MTSMRSSVLISLILLFVLAACKKAQEPTQPGNTTSGLTGQIYANAGPGFFPVDTIATVVVLASDSSTVVAEVHSDSAGTFLIHVTPGIYYLSVRESHDPYVSGPFEVLSDAFTEARAYLYNSEIV